jgi:hypothetical protein
MSEEVLSRTEMFDLGLKRFCRYLTEKFSWLEIELEKHPIDDDLHKMNLTIKGNGDGGIHLQVKEWKTADWLKIWVHNAVFGR